MPQPDTFFSSILDQLEAFATHRVPFTRPSAHELMTLATEAIRTALGTVPPKCSAALHATGDAIDALNLTSYIAAMERALHHADLLKRKAK